MYTVYDCIRFICFLVIVIATSTRKCQTWMLTDLVASTICGTLTLLSTFPASRTSYSPLVLLTTQNLDSLHFVLLRCVAVAIISINVIWFLSYKSRDGTVIGSLLWSRIVGHSCQLIVMIFAWSSGSSEFTKQFVVLGMAGTFSLLLGNIIQLVKSRPILGRHEFEGKSSLIFRLSFLLLFVIAMTGLAFPHLPLKASSVQVNVKLDRFHSVLYREFAGFLLSWLMIFWYAPAFRNISDKRAVLCSQLTWLLSHFALLMFGIYEGAWGKTQYMWLKVIAAAFISSILPAIGLYFLRKEELGNPSSRVPGKYNLRSSKDD